MTSSIKNLAKPHSRAQQYLNDIDARVVFKGDVFGVALVPAEGSAFIQFVILAEDDGQWSVHRGLPPASHQYLADLGHQIERASAWSLKHGKVTEAGLHFRPEHLTHE